MVKYKIKIDKSKCIGCGTCAALAANTFEIGSDMKAKVKKVDGDDDKTILQAAESCPTQAIELTEDGKKVFPEE
jgi:ferredoxin